MQHMTWALVHIQWESTIILSSFFQLQSAKIKTEVNSQLSGTQIPGVLSCLASLGPQIEKKIL